ncbi:MAG: TIGR01459 family HAD-type hydrolase [Janthinobacterium lividum]
MSSLIYKNILSTLDDYDIYLFDLWGVIIEGNKLYPGVIEIINEISSKKSVAFVSNAPRSARGSFEKLKSWGLNVLPNMVFTSGEIARQIMISSKDLLNIETPIIYHLGADRNIDINVRLNLSFISDIDRANILLLTLYRDEQEDLEEFDSLLKKAAVRDDLKVICANPDTTIPNLGAIRYCSGYFAKKLEHWGGKVIYTGKPHNIIYQHLLKNITHDVPKHRILMIGDTLETDILGANMCGIHSALVLTGNSEHIHNEYSNLTDKLQAIEIAARGLKLMPNMVINI